ncbi:MAG: type II secretory pathway protein [Verrucomicrobiales bacterium]|jgi:type IV pilus assembly protein PilQ|nr:type II secretory pathway protein [Verrucomicrobiales bacterium]MDP6678972.1 type II secretion system protein GspD [Verrucomicrobiota bacterium]MDP6753508.1 type II secretion system protein GspD [Verrucomicrobiota bacterium]
MKTCNPREATDRLRLAKRSLSLAFGLALATAAGCQSSKQGSDGTFNLNDRVEYSAAYDRELELIFSLAERGKWEEAEAEVSLLLQQYPEDNTLLRIGDWVATQKTLLREQAIEDRIRSIDATHTGMNPTAKDIWKDEKSRGLPPRKDIRDALEMIQAEPYVPDSFGKKITKQGFLFDAQSEQGRMSGLLENAVSIQVDQKSVKDILFDIGGKEDINFVADEGLEPLQQKLTLNLEKVKLGELLGYISRNAGVQFQVGEDLIWVIDSKSSKELIEQTRFYRLRKGFMMPAQFGPEETTLVTVKNAKAGTATVTETAKYEMFVNDSITKRPSIEDAIARFFKGPDFMIDYERNLIVATGTPAQFEVLERIIEEFDRPIQQVLIEARFITISEAAFLDFGFRWASSVAGSPPQDQTGIGNGALGREEGLLTRVTFNNVFKENSILSNADLSAALTALEQSGESQLLSAPRLTLLNNRPGNINDGQVNYYYEEFTIEETLTERQYSQRLVPKGKPEKINAGVSLDVVASIGGDGQSILIALHPVVNQNVTYVSLKGQTIDEASEGDQSQSRLEIFLPQWRTQELATRVVVGSGQSIMMGGVLEREQRTIVESVPILGNLPGIGSLFRKRSTIDRPRYLLIFVTATLLDENGSFVSYEPPGGGHPAPVSLPKSLPTPGPTAFPPPPAPAKPAEGK